MCEKRGFGVLLEACFEQKKELLHDFHLDHGPLPDIFLQLNPFKNPFHVLKMPRKQPQILSKPPQPEKGQTEHQKEQFFLIPSPKRLRNLEKVKISKPKGKSLTEQRWNPAFLINPSSKQIQKRFRAVCLVLSKGKRWKNCTRKSMNLSRGKFGYFRMKLRRLKVQVVS